MTDDSELLKRRAGESVKRRKGQRAEDQKTDDSKGRISTNIITE